MIVKQGLRRVGFAVLVTSMVLFVWAETGSAAVAKEALAHLGPALAKSYTAQPIIPPLPNHLWMDVGDGRYAFLHFNKPVSDPKARPIFIGDAVKGRFCAQDQPDKGETGFVHFHRATKPEAAKHGHGGFAGEEGIWLRHIALGEFDMMKRHFTPGIAHNFMATPPPFCP
ncbi:MAG: hypothetical protein ACE5MM_01115 [Nitrospiraceae bacterium]